MRILTRCPTCAVNGMHLFFSGNVGYISGYESGVDWRELNYNGLQHVFRTYDTERMRISSAGNVGIGTSTPTQKLTVATGSITADNYYFNNQNTTVAQRVSSTVSGISNAGYTTICNVDGDSLASGIRIALMGTAAAVVVNVVADILVNHFQDIYIESKSGIYTLLTLKVISDGNQSFTIQATTNSSTPVQLNVEVFPLNSETITFNPGSTYADSELIHPCVPGSNISATGGDASTNGNLSVSGRVGIGTSSPLSKLQVGEGVANSNYLYRGLILQGGFSTSSIRQQNLMTFGGIGYFNTNPLNDTAAGYDRNWHIGSVSDVDYFQSSRFSFIISGSEKLNILQNGNVGIGQSTPRKKLEIAGDIITTGTASYYDVANGNTFDLRPVNYGFGLRLKPHSAASGVTNRNFQIGLWDNANTYYPLTTIDDTGNMGIGTIAPNSKLDVNGNVIITGSISVTAGITTGTNVGIGTTSPYSLTNYTILTIGDNSASKIGLIKLRSNYNSGDGAEIYQSSTGDVYINKNSTTSALFMSASGNVGIGTITPSTYLQVNSKTNYSSPIAGTTASSSAFFSNFSGNYGLLIGTDGQSAGTWLSSQRVDGSAGAYPIFLNPNGGNVGIGTGVTSLTYTLHVNGSVAGTSAYNNLSDKRFKKDIQPIENALNKILSLNGITFNWDRDATDMNLDNYNHIGLLAQDVELVLPQAVSTGVGEEKIKSVAYTDIVPVLIEAMKEQQLIIEDLKNRIILLESK